MRRLLTAARTAALMLPGRALAPRVIAAALCCSLVTHTSGQATAEHSQFVVVDAPAVVLKNVRVIDGLGSPPREGQSALIVGGKIKAIGASVEAPQGAEVRDLSGRTVMPGLVMLHEHLNYFSGRAIWHSQPVSYPKLYLAAGVTTIRTAGTEQPEVDLNLKRRIDKDPRQTPGPKIHLTGPFFNGEAGGILGDTIVRDEKEASNGCREAADLGIDSIEHSFVSCAKDLGADADRAGFKADASAPKFQELVRHLVKAGVVMVATPMALDRPLSAEELDMLHPHERERYLRAAVALPPWLPDAGAGRELRKLERAFVAAGGRLGVGADASDFGLIAGYANQRVVGLLVEAGWTPLEAIRLVTSNNAELLGVGDSVGRIAEGWAADLIVVAGNPAADIKDLSKVEIVFRDGVGYDPAKLRAAAKGLVGWH